MKLSQHMIKKHRVGAVFSVLYALWHVLHAMVRLHAHLIFVKMITDKSLFPTHMDSYQAWTYFGNYLGSFTGGTGKSYKWCAFILIFFVLMILCGVRYTVASYLSAHALAAACIWVIRWACGFYPQIAIGPANYFTNLKSGFFYTGCALGIALLLYLPICYHRRKQQKANR